MSTSKIGWRTAAAIVIANMIGTGVFTSLGFQLLDTTNTWSILGLWMLGALLALCGALSYAELGTHLLRSGGEYHFLSKMYHPSVGYLSGWVSLTVGFAAPVALAAMALGEYLELYLLPGQLTIGIGAVLLVTLAHSLSLKKSSGFQNITTALKLLIILFFVVSGLALPAGPTAFDWSAGWKGEIWMPAYAVSFVYVTFSYSGWNAAAYITEEIRNARRNLPRALIVGTLVVSALYLLLNVVFLRQGTLATLQGKLEVGQVAATAMYGARGGMLLSLGIGLMLISSISAMVWAGPRVTQVMAEDHRLWHWFAAKEKGGIPLRAIWLQTFITLALMLTGTFEQVLLYSGFVLQLFSALAVASVFRLRQTGQGRDGFRSPWYPWPQLIFLGLSVWVLIYLFIEQPVESLLGTANVLLGWGTYQISHRLNRT